MAEALLAAGHRAIVASQGGRLVDRLVAAGGEHIELPVATKDDEQPSLPLEDAASGDNGAEEPAPPEAEAAVPAAEEAP